MLSRLLTLMRNSVAAPGQQAWTTPGTYTFTVPSGITEICAVCIGGGGSGNNWSYAWAYKGGGGGALSYSNAISVTPASAR